MDEGAKRLETLEEAGETIDLSATFDYLYYDLKKNSRIEDAVQVLQRKLERYLDSYYSYCYLATLYQHLGAIDKAVAACNRAIEINPNRPDAKEILKDLETRQAD